MVLLMSSKDNSWQPFFFESNDCFGWIHSPKEWEDVKKFHSISYLEKAKRWMRFDPVHPEKRYNCKHPYFGYSLKCKGEQTLGDFFIKYDMEM